MNGEGIKPNSRRKIGTNQLTTTQFKLQSIQQQLQIK
jgi:hypothetical protein